MKHIENTILEKLYLNPDELSAQEKETISLHLKECALCREHSTKLKDFYHQLQDNLASPPTEQDEAFAEKILARKRLALPAKRQELPQRIDNALDTFVEIIEPYHRPLAQRIMRYIQFHPLRVASGFSLAASLVFATLLLRPIFKDTNPVYAKIEKYVLTVLNKDSEVLWKKSVIGVPDCSSEDKYHKEDELRRFLLIRDIDGDGKNEVFLKGHFQHSEFTADTLYCLNSDGHLRWKAGAGSWIYFGEMGKSHQGLIEITDFFTITQPHSSKLRLFVLASIHQMSPVKLFEIDPENGKELHSYFNRGGTQIVDHWDFNRDGKEEILLAGINDCFNRAYLTILDADKIDGYAPVTPQYQPTGIQKAVEKYCLLFPLSKLHEMYGRTLYNNVRSLEILKDGKIRVYITEDLRKDTPANTYDVGEVYLFHPDLEVEAIAPNDNFIKLNDYLLKRGKLKKSLIPEHLEELKKTVLYWDGEKFLNRTILNILKFSG
jgi:hypothetical protein